MSLSSDGITRLLESTEGWPAGIYLARLWLAGKAEPDEAVRRFSGENRFIGDYLTEEVLSQHTSKTRDFMVTMSFLDRFSAPLCNFVGETTDAAAILHELERSNLFLIPLDEDRRWFRFHHLFAAVANGELEADHPERVPGLHARAAQWFREHDHIDEAVRHSIAGGDMAGASALVQAHWLSYVDAGRAATVRAWLDALGRHRRRPRIRRRPSWRPGWRHSSETETELTRLLTELEEVGDYGPLPDGTRSVESAVAMIQGLFGYGGPVEMLAGARRAAQLETDAHSPYYAVATHALGHAAYVWGDLDAAASLLGKAAYNEAAPAVIEILGLATLSLVEAERGHRQQSGELARAAMQIVDDKRLRSMPQVSMAFTALGQAQAAEGSLEAAMESLEEGLILRRRQPEQGPWGVLHHLLGHGQGRCRGRAAGTSAGAGRRGGRANGAVPRRHGADGVQARGDPGSTARATRRLGARRSADRTRARRATPATGLAEPPRHRTRAVPLHQHRQDPHQRRSTASSAPIRGRRPFGSLMRAS